MMFNDLYKVRVATARKQTKAFFLILTLVYILLLSARPQKSLETPTHYA